MISIVRDKVKASTAPSRELDCEIHEVITGQLDLQSDQSIRAHDRSVGRMLLDLGSQRLRVDVPRYTADADEAASNLFDREHALKITYSTSEIERLSARVAARFADPDFAMAKWMASVWMIGVFESLAVGRHDATLALCLCDLALELRMKK